MNTVHEEGIALGDFSWLELANAASVLRDAADRLKKMGFDGATDAHVISLRKLADRIEQFNSEH